MSDLNEIENLTQRYAEDRTALGGEVQLLHDDIEAAKRRRLPSIRSLVAKASASRDRLKATLEENLELFTRPKSRVFHGIKVGKTKQKGRVIFDDEAAVIKRIREKLPEEQAELLVRVRESVDKNAVADLTAADLKRLGITIEEAGETIVIKPVDGEVDKLVNALLGDIDAEKIEEQAA